MTPGMVSLSLLVGGMEDGSAVGPALSRMMEPSNRARWTGRVTSGGASRDAHTKRPTTQLAKPSAWKDLYGGDEGDRTPDLMTASHALSQLSYIPNRAA